MMNRSEINNPNGDGNPYGTFTINKNNTVTNTPRVDLGIESSKIEQVRFRNENGTWTLWEKIVSSKEWTLEQGSGYRTVEAEFRDADSNVIPWNDDILLIEKVMASDGFSEDHLGSSVDISSDGRTIVAGSPGDNGNDSGFSTDQGAAYVYSWNGTDWDEVRLTGKSCLTNDSFGATVSISDDGNRIAVGAPYHDISIANDNQGAVYIFEKQVDGSWNEVEMIFVPTGSGNDRFGYSVALSGDSATLAVGAPYKDSGTGTVYVFTYSGGTWSNTDVIEAGNRQVNDLFGLSVSVDADGSVIAVGAPERTIGYTANYGSAYVYSSNGSGWNEVELNFSTGVGYDYFGSSISVSGDGLVVAVGARGHKQNSNERQGDAFVYRYESGAWNQYELSAPAGEAYDYYGCSIASSLDGEYILVGAHFDDYNAVDQGTAILFTWDQLSSSYVYNDIYYGLDGAFEDHFGTSLAITPDGTTLAIGASHEEGSALNQGSVYYFRR